MYDSHDLSVIFLPQWQILSINLTKLCLKQGNTTCQWGKKNLLSIYYENKTILLQVIYLALSMWGNKKSKILRKKKCKNISVKHCKTKGCSAIVNTRYKVKTVFKD